MVLQILDSKQAIRQNQTGKFLELLAAGTQVSELQIQERVVKAPELQMHRLGC